MAEQKEGTVLRMIFAEQPNKGCFERDVSPGLFRDQAFRSKKSRA